MKRLIGLSALLLCSLTTRAQMTTTTGMTPTQYVQNVLVGSGVVVSNVTFSGYTNAIGEFTINGPTNLGMNNGLVLSTGTVLEVDPTYGTGQGPHGPNDSPGVGVDNFEPGDPYLTSIAGTSTFNRAVLEFDFIPTGDTVKFNYVFGTEEYMEWVGGGYADVFAFLLEGVSTPLAQTNIALLPSGQVVTALNVNANVNPQYYVDNETPPGQTVQYDGFTVVLEAKHHVICGETYHIKLMIADAIDGGFDAAVFLQAGSLTSQQLEISASTLNGLNNVLLEKCGNNQEAVFTFSRPDSTSTDTIFFDIGGTATMGSDYNTIADSIVFAVGQTSASFSVYPILDTLTEGQETITFFIIYYTGCGIDTVEATIYIEDFIPIEIQTGDVPEHICTSNGEFAILAASATGGYGDLIYEWSSGGGFGDTVIVAPPETTLYTVTVTDTCGNSVTSHNIEVNVQCDILVPNVFTPNGDGKNDFFHILNIEDYPNSRLTILDRWGRKVYENSNYLNNWDGDGVADGTYYFILKPTDPDITEQHGHVTILR